MSPCVYHCVAFTRNNACAEAWRGRKRRKSGRVMENSLSTTVRPTLRPRVSLPPPPLLPLPFRFRSSRNMESWTKTRSQEWEYRKQGEFLKIDIDYTNNAEDKHVISMKLDLPSSKKICSSNIFLHPFFFLF